MGVLNRPVTNATGRPVLHALSCVCVSDANKSHVLPEGDARVLDAFTTVLSWGTPGSPADGGGGRWSPIMVRYIRHAAHAWGAEGPGAYLALV